MAESMDTNPMPPLLKAIRQLPTGSLYGRADKEQITEALHLCNSNAVAPPQWDPSRTQLSVEVGLNRTRTVVLTLQDQMLHIDCTCGQPLDRHLCRDALAVLFALKKALDPQSVPGWRGSQKSLEAIRSTLCQPAGLTHRSPSEQAEPTHPLAVVLAVEDDLLAIEVWHHGRPVQRPASFLPEELQSLLSLPHGPSAYSGLVLGRLLDQGPPAWPLLLRDQQGRRRIQVEPPFAEAGALLLDACQDGLWLSRILADGSRLGTALTTLGNWLLDIRAARLVRCPWSPAWDQWEELADQWTPQPDGALRLAWDSFFGLQSHAPPGQAPPTAGFLLQRQGTPQQPARETLKSYLLTADTSQDGQETRIRAGARHGSAILSLDGRGLALFGEDLYRRLSPALRTLKRRRILCEAFLAACQTESVTEQGKILRRFLKGPEFIKRAVTREARELLKYLLDIKHMESWSLNFIDRQWCWLKRDGSLEISLLELLLKHFDQVTFRNSEHPGRFSVPSSRFRERLPQLLADLHREGIDLLCDGRPAMPIQFDITITATAAGIDWFELQPEIRCQGQLLEESEWQQALHEGFVQIDGRLLLVDSASQQVLRELQLLSGTERRQRRRVVRIPRLHILDCLALRRLGATLRLAPEDEAILQRLEHFSSLPQAPLPELGTTLRDYQRQGYDWLAFLYQNKFGACLADDMGLGKTVQAISLLAALHQGRIPSHGAEGWPHLVVVPPSLLFNWEIEFARFAPELRIVLYRGQQRKTDFNGSDVVLTTYDLVRRDLEQLAALNFHVIIFDEAQAIKNVHAAVTGAVRRLRGTFKLALTGTPVENHLGEFWSIIDLALPGLLGDYRRFGALQKAADHDGLSRLIQRTRPFVLRRSKEKIADELPDKVEIDMHLEMTDLQKRLYRKTVEEVRRTVDDAYRGQSAAQARVTALAALTRLRRLCLDPRLVDDQAAEGVASPKIAALCEQLLELRDEGHSVLVFSQFTSFLDLVEEGLNHAGLPWLRLDGRTPVAARKDLVRNFQHSSEPLVFLLSLKAGGRGLNLTRASYVVHLDPWWNPAVENQASDRAHRIGQQRKVTVLRLIMRHSVEEKMMLLKEGKQRLFRALLEEGRDVGRIPLSREDFEFLTDRSPE